MQTDYKIRVLTTIVSFLCMTLTLWGADTLQHSHYKHVTLSTQSLNSFPNIAAKTANDYHYGKIKVSLGYPFDNQALSTEINSLDNFSSSPRLCDAGNLIFSSPLFSQKETINEKFSVVPVTSALISPSILELAIPPPGDCPLLEALAKDLADPDKGPALNAYLDEFLTPNSPRVQAWENLFNLNVHGSLRSNPNFLEDFAVVRPKYEKSGPMIGKEIGHTYSKHGSHNTKQLLYQAVNGTTPIGQWLNDVAAEDFIARHLDQLSQGTRDIPLPHSTRGIGRVFKNNDGQIFEATHIRLVPSGTGVDTAFPINETLVSLNPLGVYKP